MELRAPYNYDVNAASDESGITCKDPSKTQQHQAEEADINTIVKRFGLTGVLPSNVRMPTYGDFTGITDYQTALNSVIEANRAFMTLPAHVRARFDNDAGLFVDFCSDPANLEEAKKLGLVESKDPVPPAPVGATPAEPAGDGKTAPAATVGA